MDLQSQQHENIAGDLPRQDPSTGSGLCLNEEGLPGVFGSLEDQLPGCHAAAWLINWVGWMEVLPGKPAQPPNWMMFAHDISGKRSKHEQNQKDGRAILSGCPRSNPRKLNMVMFGSEVAQTMVLAGRLFART